MSATRVFITGCARSGTSLVAGVLKDAGLTFGAPLIGPNRWNPTGQMEHRPIREKVLKPLLREMGADPRGQKRLPPRHLNPPPARVARLRKAMDRRLNGAQAYKDAKILLAWQYFLMAYPDARWVLVRRDPKDIVASCIRTDFMNGRTYKQEWIDWVQDHEFRMDDLKRSAALVLEVWPDPEDPESFRGVIEWLGLTYDAPTIRRRLRPAAWHGAT